MKKRILSGISLLLIVAALGRLGLTGCSKNYTLSIEKTNQPIEHLVFMTDPGKEQQWIELDHQYWTEYLSKNSGFIKKEVWLSPDNPGEIHTLIWWNSMDEWKQFSEEDVTKNDEKCTKALGSQKSIYTNLTEVNRHDQLFAIQNTKKVLK